ncbi:MAG: hypothetical protein QXN55_00260 [Candidatus Nitrosotenuis sp.]
MSRTFRRINNTSAWREEWFTCESKYEKIPAIGWLHLPRTFKKGKEYRKGWWKFHGDGKEWYYGKCFNKSWSQVRAGNRVNIARFFRDEEFDLIPYDLERKRDWY